MCDRRLISSGSFPVSDFSYAFFEIPSNILLKRLTPSKWFGTITVLVGACMLSQGVVKSYGGLLATRFCLGIAEAGLFPGANVVLAGWYPRKKFGLRAAIFFSAATVSGAFGGLLSVGLSKIRAGEYSGTDDGWRWIFIVIGLLTSVAGILSFWICPDFPDTARFLNEQEKAWVIATLQQDQQASAAGEAFSWRNVFKAIFDFKSVIGSLIYCGADGPLYAFSVFTPTIVQSLGTWNSVQSNLLTVPIYVWACLVTIGVGFFADRKGHRAAINLVFFPIGIIGYIILIAADPHKVSGVSYFGIYLAATGIYPMIPNTIALTGSSIEGAYKRSVVMAWIISFGNINGAATSNVYLPRQKPRYFIGHGIIIMYLAIGWIATLAYLLVLKRANAQRERGACDETLLDHLPEHQAVQQAEAARAKAIADVQTQGGLANKWRALMMKLHSAPGGTYANMDEARRLKGDDFSAYRYGL